MVFSYNILLTSNWKASGGNSSATLPTTSRLCLKNDDHSVSFYNNQQEVLSFISTAINPYIIINRFIINLLQLFHIVMHLYLPQYSLHQWHKYLFVPKDLGTVKKFLNNSLIWRYFSGGLEESAETVIRWSKNTIQVSRQR